MDFLLRLVAVGATFVLVAATALMLLTFRRARRVTTASLLVPVGTSVAVLMLSAALLGATPSAGWFLVDLVLGAGLGALWARTHRLFRAQDGGVRSRANLWYLAVWATVLALNQLVAVVADRSSRVLVGLLVFSTGIALGNGLVLVRRMRRLRVAAAVAIALLVAGTAETLADDVLLLLPGDFDVQPISGWYRDESQSRPLTAKELSGDPNPFRFRGEEVTQEMTRVDHHTGAECSIEIRYHHEYTATFRRGRLEGRWVTDQRNFYRGCKGVADGEYMRVTYDAPVTGQAQADGRLDVTVRVASGEIFDRKDGWVRRDQRLEPWSFGLRFQLPVGELQSSQKLTKKPASVPVPAVAPKGTADAPVTPAAAAGAATGAAALSLLGAVWMLASSGVRPSDLLSAPPAADLPPPEAPPAHRDGDVNPETGEVWSEPDHGWVGRNLYELDRGERLDEIRRAQAVSDAEARRRSVETAEGLRASEARQRAAAAAEAEAARLADLEAAHRPETIEPYRPAWSDRVTTVLEWAEYGADTSVSLLGEVTGKAGQTVGRVYTVTKETVKGASEGVADYVRGKGGDVAPAGSAWVIVERAGAGLARGGAKVGLDAVAGKVMEGVARFAKRPLPELPDLADARLVRVVKETAEGAAEATTRNVVSIAVGKTAASQQIQKPAAWAVEAATGEKL